MISKLISIIAPMYNESKLVNEYCKETLNAIAPLKDKYDFELILVNDGSKDDTYKLMLEQQAIEPNIISTVDLSRNFGLEGAVKAGLRCATGDAVIVMDADLQDPPSLIPQMIEKWENGFDVVVCNRNKRPNDTLFKRFSALVFYKILDSLSGKLKIGNSAANFRLLSRAAVDKVLDLPEVNGVFRVLVPFIGMKTDVILYDRDKRFAGNTKYNLKSMIPYALDSITSISVVPLRKITLFVPLLLLISLFFITGCFFVSSEFVQTFIICSTISVISLVLFTSICVLAEYIAQITIEVKHRPESIIYDYKPSRNTRNI